MSGHDEGAAALPLVMPARLAFLRVDREAGERLEAAIVGVLHGLSILRVRLKPGHPALDGPASVGVRYYGEPSAPLDVWEACRVMWRLRAAWSEVGSSLADLGDPRLGIDLARALDDVLVASPRLRRWVRPSAPALSEAVEAGHAFYGPGRSAELDLWLVCRAIEQLRTAWCGRPAAQLGVAGSAPGSAEDEAPGLAVELLARPDDDAVVGQGSLLSP